MPTKTLNFRKFNIFTKDLIDGKHNFTSNTFKVALTNTAPALTNTVLANITQVAAAGGYTTGGTTVTVTTSTASGVAKVVIADKTITSVEDSNGNIPTFRYAVLYNDTASGDPLIGYIDYEEEITLVDTEEFILNFNDTSGLFTI